MPADLFDPTMRPAPVGGGGRRLTVTTSVVVHVVVVVLIVVVPLIGGVSLPAAMSRIDAFIAPLELPPPPMQQPPPTATNAPPMNPDAAPLHAPDTIAPEVERPPAAGVVSAPGGLPIGAGVGVPGSIPNVGPVSIAQPPPPVEQGPVRAGGKVQFPKRVSYVEPVYPQIATTARVEGTVILEAIIDESGAVTNLRVIRSIPLLDEAAKQAVARWRYSPTTLNGVKVPVIMTVTVTFKLH
jgi:periplasmic protein TonB